MSTTPLPRALDAPTRWLQLGDRPLAAALYKQKTTSCPTVRLGSCGDRCSTLNAVSVFNRCPET